MAGKRNVVDRGRSTLPKRLRDAFDIHGDDEVAIREGGDKIVIEKLASRADLTEDDRRRAHEHRVRADEIAAGSCAQIVNTGNSSPSESGRNASSTSSHLDSSSPHITAHHGPTHTPGVDAASR